MLALSLEAPANKGLSHLFTNSGFLVPNKIKRLFEFSSFLDTL